MREGTGFIRRPRNHEKRINQGWRRISRDGREGGEKIFGDGRLISARGMIESWRWCWNEEEGAAPKAFGVRSLLKEASERFDRFPVAGGGVCSLTS